MKTVSVTNRKSAVIPRLQQICKDLPKVAGKVIQSIGYLLIYILAVTSSMFFSILFWNPNVKVDTNSWCGFDLNLLFSDINGVILLLFIIAIELFKINDSLTILRDNNDNNSINRLLKLFLFLSVLASISFFTINSNTVKELLNVNTSKNSLDILLDTDKKTPIEIMIDIIFMLIDKKDLKLIFLIFSNSIYSIIIEIVIISIPKRLKVIWVNKKVITYKKKVKFKVPKVIKIIYKVILNHIKKSLPSKQVINNDLVVKKVINENEKSYTEKGKVINLKKEVINKGKKVYREPKLTKDLLKLSNEVLKYLEKLSSGKSLEIKPIIIQSTFNIDHNKWLKLRRYFIYHNLFSASERKTYFTMNKKYNGGMNQ